MTDETHHYGDGCNPPHVGPFNPCSSCGADPASRFTCADCLARAQLVAGGPHRSAPASSGSPLLAELTAVVELHAAAVDVIERWEADHVDDGAMGEAIARLRRAVES